MTETEHRPEQAGETAALGVPQNLVGGLILVALALLALWLLKDLEAGTLGAMGSALMPRALAVGLAVLGGLVAASSFVKRGHMLERLPLRGPVFVLLAIVVFAVTIRPFQIGSLGTPGLGIVVSAPLAIVISGFATPEARLRELLILALGLTPLCMLLFGDMLNLTIPMMPQALIDAFPDGWSQKAVLRVAAAAMLACAGLIHLSGRTHSGGSTAEARD